MKRWPNASDCAAHQEDDGVRSDSWSQSTVKKPLYHCSADVCAPNSVRSTMTGSAPEATRRSAVRIIKLDPNDFKNPEIRPYLDQYLRGSNGYNAEERVKLLKLLWDCLASEFGGRHELYEINYGGSTEEIRRYCLFGAQASGNADRFKGFAEECMAEYDLDGWRVPDLTDPGELSYHVMRGAST